MELQPNTKHLLKRLVSGSATIAVVLTMFAFLMSSLHSEPMYEWSDPIVVVEIAGGYLALVAFIALTAGIAHVLSTVTPLPPIVEVDDAE